jgi:hypothetical protein
VKIHGLEEKAEANGKCSDTSLPKINIKLMRM